MRITSTSKNMRLSIIVNIKNTILVEIDNNDFVRPVIPELISTNNQKPKETTGFYTTCKTTKKRYVGKLFKFVALQIG